MQSSSVNMKYPQNSPYVSKENAREFKVNENKVETMLKAEKAQFQGQLKKSTIRLNLDDKNNKLTYNNNNSSANGSPKDLVYNTNATDISKKTSWAEQQDKAPKSHLTQMQTLGSTAVARRSTSVRPPASDTRFKTIADSYFGMRRTTRNGPTEVEKDIL